MAGVGVMFYVMHALQDELFDRGAAFKDPSFNVERLLPFVAIGTVADVVALDANNREIVRRGLEMIHKGCGYPGIEALATVSGKKHEQLSSTDIGFGLGPRINAAGRLEQMDLGVECLIETDPTAALEKAVNLHALNMERKTIEAEISEEAFNKLLHGFTEESRTVVVASDDWHQGVVGIVASRIKDRVYRPSIVFTMDSPELLKGSARSIPGFHLRDALELLDKRNPGVIVKFGGHAMAAGLTIRADKLQKFKEEFEKIATSLLTKEDLQQILEVDGELDLEDMTLETAEAISKVTWGQAFPSPLFLGTFQVKSQHFTKDGNHLRLVLEKDGQVFEGIRFRHSGGALRPVETLAYKLDSNEFKNDKKLQILVEHVIR
jgi:single-stranded-DNA-specific exonuclease